MTARAKPADLAAARRVRERRLMLGITQAELGALTGVSYQQLHKYETGKNRMAVGTLIGVATALGSTAAELLHGIRPAEALTRQDYAEQRAMLELARNAALLDLPTRRALAAFVRALVARGTRP